MPNRVVNCMVYLHITAELKSYWVTCFFICVCSNVGSICRLQ